MQADMAPPPPQSWWDSIRPYLERAPLAALLLGISSGFPYAMIGATLTTRLSQDGFEKSSITAFSLAFLVYNFKPLWAWIVDTIRLPGAGVVGQRISWLILTAMLVMLAVGNLALVDPQQVGQSPVGHLMQRFGLGHEGEFAALFEMAVGAVLVGAAGATFDIVIDAYRIEILKPEQLGVGSGMSQYGWRIGSAGAGALALFLAARQGWEAAYLACALFALPAVIAGFWVGEPERHRAALSREGKPGLVAGIIGPFREFFSRHGAWLVLLFILLHKIGDTLANLTLRLLLNDLGFSNDEIAIYDVGIGFWAYLIGIFIGGILYARMGMKKSVLLSLILMAVSNFSFALLAAAGHSNWGLAGAIGFENIASGIGGVVVVAYFSALCDLRFTAAHYALISSAASIVGRFLTGTTAGAMMDNMGNVNFYLFTVAAALPGIVLFWLMMRSGLVDQSVGTAGTRHAREASA
ncbi:MFS transporter [Sphingopyxis terrae subsp. terrae NBRC 15098]|uniref:MFS transporter n=1 Tax=Sphingopyxis terrae subsp. terrae NBRC 15098 TaxID=1219058 RepID=A0A142W3G4_9SPHN|nr:MFS transporter [Sphingopyxis terrae]AMU96075.1 MFS transporter [Sphingopyxis terrae subsp. terrae NBRC 15098]